MLISDFLSDIWDSPEVVYQAGYVGHLLDNVDPHCTGFQVAKGLQLQEQVDISYLLYCSSARFVRLYREI